ncbi:MAG: secondary thiamine-phosphate synthase enzyme YjbQ [Promethearchaeota archaeon]|jgi:secondary thiamine-phosphate synthase enzyme
MTVDIQSFELRSKAYCDVINITKQVQKSLKNSGINDGIVNVHVAGSTGAISTIEYEPGLVQTDIKELLEKLIPYGKDYNHTKTWGDHNGAGHLRSFLLKTSQSFPFKNQDLILGTWQQISFIECDEKPRSRKIYCTIIGE